MYDEMMRLKIDWISTITIDDFLKNVKNTD